MTIDDVMALAHGLNIHGTSANAIEHRSRVRAAILALISERENAEAEACADVAQSLPKMAAFMSDMPVQDKIAKAIRARIDARKGGAKP